LLGGGSFVPHSAGEVPQACFSLAKTQSDIT
jgi:hypothetical protein